jgi:hypothetical protein
MPASSAFTSGIAAIKSYTIAQLADRTALWDASIHNAPVPYVFDAASSATADDINVLMPSGSPAVGRWVKAATGGGITLNSNVTLTTNFIQPPGGYDPLLNPTGVNTWLVPSINPTSIPTAIGQTLLINRLYTGSLLNPFTFSTTIIEISRSAYYTAIGLAAADWRTDRSGSVSVQYISDGGNPVTSDPSNNLIADLSVQPDYVGQMAVISGQGWSSTRRSQVQGFTNNLPGVQGGWWDWS